MIRILVVDNYDNFTFNIVQYLAEITGTQPTVVRNDETTWDAICKEHFSAFVISPGPGQPGRQRDLGLGAVILRESKVPVLGICLGHQGLVHAFGGEVSQAPEPVHGRVSFVSHDGRGIFKDIPSPFRAVRYHSLIAQDPVPEVLRVTATSGSNLIMGVEHRERSLFGVQFHPESIQTEFGKLLLRNFVDIARERDTQPDRQPVPASGSAEPRPEAAKWKLLYRRLQAPIEPVAAFQQIFARASTAFWLDSSLVKPGLSRFSYMGDATGPNAFTFRYSLTEGATRTDSRGSEAVREDLFSFLRRHLAVELEGLNELPFAFCGGFVGYFGYELKTLFGGTNRHRSSLPDATWLFADRFLAFDHELGDWYLVAVHPAGQEDKTANAWFEEIASSLVSAAPVEQCKTPQRAGSVPFALESDRAHYLQQIAAAKRAISEGETYQVCLTNRLRTANAKIDSLALYRKLRDINPAPYAAYVTTGDLAILCSSPERFLKLSGNRVIESKPIKGTRRRVSDAGGDATLAGELVGSEKERAENLMITDLVRNDLSRICELGSVWVPLLMQVESYETVHQLVSTVRGQLRTECDILDAVHAAFPPGSMTGAPKARTLAIIDELENSARGIYSGALGYLSLSGAADLNVVIRTIVQTEHTLEIGVGGAITTLSDPHEEFEEILLKGKAPSRAIASVLGAEVGEGLRELIGSPMEPSALNGDASPSPQAPGSLTCRGPRISSGYDRRAGTQNAETLLFAEQHGLPFHFNVAGWLTDHVAPKRPDRIALIGEHTPMTYGQLAHSVRRAAFRLARNGVYAEQRVALIAADSPNSAVCFLAILYVGATAILLNPKSSPRAISDALGRCGSTHVVTDGDTVSPATLSCSALTEALSGEGDGELFAAARTSPFSPAFGLFTSGPAGAPRLVLHRHQDPIVAATRYGAQVLAMTPHDVVLSTCHSASAIGLESLLITLLHGATFVFCPLPGPVDACVGHVVRHRPTILFAAPSLYGEVLNDDSQRSRFPPNGLRACISGGEPSTEELRRGWHAQYGIDLLASVSSPESFCTYISAVPGVSRPGATGKLVPGFDAMLRDETGHVCRTGERGVLWLRGPSIPNGYDGDLEESEQPFVDGWFCTKDVFCCDAEGYFRYCGGPG